MRKSSYGEKQRAGLVPLHHSVEAQRKGAWHNWRGVSDTDRQAIAIRETAGREHGHRFLLPKRNATQTLAGYGIHMLGDFS